MEAVTPKKWQILSGSALKLIAMITMLIDHATYFLLYHELDLLQPLFTVGSTTVTVYYILRTVGRLAFPLYCFLLVEGFLHTRDRKKYGINLLLFALISELPWNFAHSGTWRHGEQNVFFTLFFGYCGLCIIEYLSHHPVWKESHRPVWQVIGIVALFAVTFVFEADYGYMGFAAILAMYLLRKLPVARAIVGICLFGTTWRAGLAFVPIALYNGERGFIKGKSGKYVCYAFYPLHLLILGILRFFVFA